MKKLEQITFIVSFLCVCWLGMQMIHEFGHVIGAWCSGGSVSQVFLHPLELSRTELSENPHPGFVCWSGPVLGVAIPAVVFFIGRALKWPGIYMYRFFAGFCLVSNGIYIAAGPSSGGADTAIMLQHGSPRFALIIFGVTALAAGLTLWHGQGRYFGLGKGGCHVSRKAMVASMLLLIIIVALNLSFFSH